MVYVKLPPPSVLPAPIFRDLPTGMRLVRIFNPTQHNTQPLTFRHHGPLARFDHHHSASGKRTNNAVLQKDPERGVYYAAVTLSCSLVEVFGDYGKIDNPHLFVAYPRITRPLRLLDLCGPGAMQAGSVSTLCATADRQFSQAWSRYFYETAVFQCCDGLIYHGAHNNEPAIVLYERAINGLDCPSPVIAITDPMLKPLLVHIATEHGMDLQI